LESAIRPVLILAGATGTSIMQLLHELNADGATILMITHDITLADQLPRRIRLLDGRVVSDTGPDRDVLVAPAHAPGGDIR